MGGGALGHADVGHVLLVPGRQLLHQPADAVPVQRLVLGVGLEKAEGVVPRTLVRGHIIHIRLQHIDGRLRPAGTEVVFRQVVMARVGHLCAHALGVFIRLVEERGLLLGKIGGAVQVAQDVIGPLEPVDGDGPFHVVKGGRGPGDDDGGVDVSEQQQGEYARPAAEYSERDRTRPLSGYGLWQRVRAAQGDEGEYAVGDGHIGPVGEHHLHRGVPRHECQRRPQGRDHGVGIFLPGVPDADSGARQQADEQDKTHGACLYQRLDIVVMSVLRVIEEGLHAADI